jgi:signal transduction histidine kinase
VILLAGPERTIDVTVRRQADGGGELTIGLIDAADRAKRRFLATVSHELRTPLTALSGYQELLADEVMGPLAENQRDMLDRMRSSTQHLASMIEELLTFANLDDGREVVRPTDFAAGDLVQSVAATIEPLIEHKHLTLAITIPETPIHVHSDRDKVRQILVSLAQNAVKFTDAGEVQLGVWHRHEQVGIFVRDTGIGIAAHDLERLFKPFGQLDASLTRRHGGAGLGLYIARGLAELLGGSIAVESTPNKGSEFTLVLPLPSAGR